MELMQKSSTLACLKDGCRCDVASAHVVLSVCTERMPCTQHKRALKFNHKSTCCDSVAADNMYIDPLLALESRGSGREPAGKDATQCLASNVCARCQRRVSALFI